MRRVKEWGRTCILHWEQLQGQRLMVLPVSTADLARIGVGPAGP